MMGRVLVISSAVRMFMISRLTAVVLPGHDGEGLGDLLRTADVDDL